MTRTARRRSLRHGAALIVSLVVLAGCGAHAGSAATTNDVACAPAIPLARSIVHDQGTLVLVRRINREDTDALSAQLHAPPLPPPPKPAPKPPPAAGDDQVPKACLLVYQGAYPPGAIAGATPPAVSGNYALLILAVRRPAVQRILVSPTLPADTRPRPWWRRLI